MEVPHWAGRVASGRALARLAIALLLLSASAGSPAQAASPFATWLAEFRQEALAQGISRETLDEALRGVKPIPRVIQLDRSQPEGRMTFERYLRNVLPEQRVNRARALYREHRALLERIGGEYGVQPRFILALWGIETDFGRNTGGFRVVDALATLAHDGRRSAYFRGELMNALVILDQRHITADAMKGSWAGALGQCQFMPSSFLRYAVDHDGDGRRDIWGTLADVFASTANYLRSVGWNASQTWGREVRLPAGLNVADLSGQERARALKAWSALGIRRADGGPLPDAALDAALVLPDGATGRAFLVYDNYRAITRWNRSTYFATAVGLFADRIGEDDLLH